MLLTAVVAAAAEASKAGIAVAITVTADTRTSYRQDSAARLDRSLVLRLRLYTAWNNVSNTADSW